jgi:hypothetical protein
VRYKKKYNTNLRNNKVISQARSNQLTLTSLICGSLVLADAMVY